MHLNNKTGIRRGIDFMNQRAAGLTLEWESDRVTRPEGGDLCVLYTGDGESTVKMWTLPGVIADDAALADQDALDVIRPNLFLCYQGEEETENSLFPNRDKFVKLNDLYMDFELKTINATQYASISQGDTLVVNRLSGFMGTSSIVADNSGGFIGSVSANKLLVKGVTVTGKSIQKNIEGQDVFVITVVC